MILSRQLCPLAQGPSSRNTSLLLRNVFLVFSRRRNPNWECSAAFVVRSESDCLRWKTRNGSRSSPDPSRLTPSSRLNPVSILTAVAAKLRGSALEGKTNLCPSGSAGEPATGAPPTHSGAVAVFLALLGVGLAWLLLPYVNGKPSPIAALVVFLVVFIILLARPALQCLPLGPRILLVLLALRPLVDVWATQRFTRLPSSGISLQDAFAAVFGVLLVGVWLVEAHGRGYTKLPNIFLIVLLGLTGFSWLIGGLGEGADSCARTAWGLMVALLLGPLFRTQAQVDIFIRTIFHSCILVLLVLSVSATAGMQYDPEWTRWGGQYVVPNILACVAFSFFVYGLYVFRTAHTRRNRATTLSLLATLAAVIVLTQSQTVGALMLISVCLCLWASRRRWLVYSVAVPLLLLLFVSTTGTSWRLISNFSLAKGQVDPAILILTGRVYQWSDWLNNFVNASLFHQVFGLGWGVMLRNFLSMGLLTSSITENSFLWFLMGTGALGLLAFIAYLFWVLFHSWGAWRRASCDFDANFALLAFLAALSFIIEGLTMDVASAPNTDIYLYAAMSIFVFQWLRNADWRSSKVFTTGILNESEAGAENLGSHREPT